MTDFTFEYSDAERTVLLELGYTDTDIDSLEASLEASFFELDGIFGVGGTYVTVNDTLFDPLA